MDTSEIEFQTAPSIEEIEAVLEECSTASVNLANCRLPIQDLDYYSSYAELITGLHIQLDTLDQDELVSLHCFRSLRYLRAELTSGELDVSDLQAWDSWCANYSASLTAVVVNLPTWNPEAFYSWMHSLAAVRQAPLTLVIYSNIKRKNSKDLYFPESPLLRVFVKSKVVLNPAGLTKLTPKNLVKNLEPSKLCYSGPLNLVDEDTDNDWILDVDKVTIDPMKSIIFAMSGSDGAGNFKCEGRALWNGAEEGFYFSSNTPLDYSRFSENMNEGNFAFIKFFNPVFDSQGNCELSGKWRQDGDEWSFSGFLEKSVSL